MAGGNNGQDLLKRFECYDLINNTCTVLPDLSVPRDELSLVALEGDIYAIGGGSSEGETLRSVEKFNVESNAWEGYSDMIEERRAHTSVSVCGTIYVMGGFDGENYLKSCEK